jgi:gluconolactonase
MKSLIINRREFLRLSAVTLAGSLIAACKSLNTEEADSTDSELPTSSAQGKILETSSVSVPALVVPMVNVLASGLDFPEGPAFDAQGILWCTELLGGNLVRWVEGSFTRIPVNGRPNGLAFDRQNRAYICDSEQNAIRRFDPVAETWETLVDQVDGNSLQTPNDLSFDAEGNLLFTCPNFADNEPTGYVCCLKPDGTIKKIAEGYYRPNGLDIVDDGKSLVVADTYRKSLYKGEWDSQTLSWNQPRLWAMVGGSEGPDGMCPGQDGMLYQAIYGDGSVKVINRSGKIKQTLVVPGANPTNVAVDPSGKLGLVVTETEKGQLISLPEIQPGVAIFDGGEAWK